MYAVMITDKDQSPNWYGPFDRNGAFKCVAEIIMDSKECDELEYHIYELSLQWSK